jgi:hypothetical protein
MKLVSRSSSFLTSASSLIAMSGLLAAAPTHAAPLDENITTSFTALGTSINWQTAGALQPQSSGTLGPFNRACVVLEGKPHTHANVVTRSVYVPDAGNNDDPNTVVLHIYIRTDTITSIGGVTSDFETIVPHHEVVLSLTGQSGAVCYMAANDTSVFVSTSANSQASIINKKTFAETLISSSSTANSGPVT